MASAPSFLDCAQSVIGNELACDLCLPDGSQVVSGAQKVSEWREDKIQATLAGAPATGYVRSNVLADGERRTKLSDGTELCENVRLLPTDYYGETLFAKSASTTYSTGNIGNTTPTAIGAGSVAEFAPLAVDAGRIGLLEFKSNASTANSGAYFAAPYNIGTFASGGNFVMRQAIRPRHANTCGVMQYASGLGDLVGSAMGAGARINVDSLVVSGQARGVTDDLKTTASTYTLTADTWYDLVMVKVSSLVWEFAVLSAAGAVLWFDSVTMTDEETSQLRLNSSWYLGATPSGVTSVVIVDTWTVATLPAWRKQTGVAALPYSATLLKFY